MGIENDMVDLGIDMWQGALPSNDIVQVQKNTKGKMLLMGGIDQGVIDEQTRQRMKSAVKFAGRLMHTRPVEHFCRVSEASSASMSLLPRSSLMNAIATGRNG